MSRSLIERAVRRFGPEKVLGMLDADQRVALPWLWRLWARPEQVAPRGEWRWWAIIAGRGFGKTRSGAEWVREKAYSMPGSRGGIIGQTPEEVRSIQIEGPAGILAVTPPSQRPRWEPSKDLLSWPNGTTAEVFSGADPGKFRGPQFHWLWADELAKWSRAGESYDNFNLGLRLEFKGGIQPQGLITTTPRPLRVIRDLLKNPRTRLSTGSTYENSANLARSFLDEIRGAYEGTRLGRQELHGELLDDVPGALWARAMFDAEGFRQQGKPEDFDLIAIGLDPSASNTETSDETGIIAVGMKFVGDQRRFHVLADRSMFGTPMERAGAAINLFQEFRANRFVVETNKGGDWIPALLQTQWDAMELPGAAPFELVTATRGKQTRAEPVSSLYEQHRVTHEPTGLEVLEDQLVNWSPRLLGDSPDRLDALVWATTWLSTAKHVVLT